ncbi:RNA polymerase sigma factor [Neobacillus muris]|uniref:RNA polymerase sigma factor n=1 Tax=Neobacillus muris TaxID=2941334 RepID=UPI00203DB945|nr:sigma-70 family RNA polymerase sigma factor [Neobacillus muris]
MPDFKNRRQPDDSRADFMEEICHNTWEAVYRFIYYKVQNREEAEDITQETYMKAISYLQRGRVHPDKYIGFLKTVALNVLRDRWRTKKRRGTTVDIDSFPVAEAPGPDLAEQSTERIFIEAGLQQLTKEQQTVIQLRIIKGHSVADTARIMNKTEVTIRVMQHRALKALADILKNNQ